MSDPIRQRLSRWGNRGLLILQVLMLILLLAGFFFTGMRNVTHDNLINLSMDCIALPVLILMFFSGLRSHSRDKTSVWFMVMIFTDTVYLFFDGISLLADGHPEQRALAFAANTAYYLCNVIMSQLFWHFLCTWNEAPSPVTRSLTHAVDMVAVVGSLVVLFNIFGRYYFDITPAGFYSRSDAYSVSMIVPTAILTICAFFIVKSKTRASDKIILISYALFPWLGAIADAFFHGPSFLCILTFLSMVFIYGSILVRRDEMLAAQQAELAQSQMQSMLLQINPHFIYNTLGSISSLCTQDPQLAEKMLLSFSGYLRNNFGELAHRSLIPLKKEIEHLELYLSIEKSRFPDITVILDFPVDSFELPSLSIQPLAENAITHGIMGRETGGTLKISSYEDERNWYVCVEDDGVGFESPEKNDGRRHVGLENVRNRLHLLCDGELRLTSTPGVGTKAEIRIPKER